ncbi:MAG: HU family DNA-binding protein [Candidatus Neomarinimicrobiota bacterium]
MTKQEIVTAVAEATGLTKVETETVMNGIMAKIIEALARNDRVELRGFGTFGVKHRLPKIARNPGTGGEIQLPERFVPTFKPSLRMKTVVNTTLMNQ